MATAFRTTIVSVIILTVLLAFVPASEAASYRGELRKVTERGRIYTAENFDAKLIWRASLFTDTYRHAHEQRHIEVNHLGPIEAARWVAEAEKRQAETWEFFVALYAHDEAKEFSLQPDSFWKVILTTSQGEELRPTSIEMIPVSPYISVMYPYVDRWSRTYRVVFPKTDLGGRTKLTLQSVLGTSTLSWRVR
ncbi:MAG: hypothetical protein HY465_00605 [Deltaproteobacteria bacterium]|nr:hypothetical protein [Deltaproteobacteria bacterium]